jgi:hypothetical protein
VLGFMNPKYIGVPTAAIRFLRPKLHRIRAPMVTYWNAFGSQFVDLLES